MSRIKKKFIRFGTGTDDVNAQVVPANYTPTSYTPEQVGSEGTDKISAHLKGINNFLATVGPEAIVSVSSNVTLTAFAIHLVSTASARNLTLPSSPSTGTKITIKDVTGSANVNNITIVRAASETIEGASASYTMDQTYQCLVLVADASGNWWIL